MDNATNDDAYRDRHGLLNTSWVGGPVLGKGAYGAPQVWLKQDEHGRIVDRVAVKDTEVTKHYKVKVGDRTYNTPVEALAPMSLQRLPGGHNVVALRNWRQNEEAEMVRLYQEFCPFGTLSSLLDQYRARYPSPTAAQGLPEAFIWHVFSCLTAVGLLMERGPMSAVAQQSEWWLIVHHDMKPDNIFLGAHQGPEWKGYPTAKLGDWGLAELYKNGRSGLTQGFLPDYRYSPPEARAPAQGELEGLAAPHDYPARRTKKTNVWAVGLQIWSLMQLSNGDDSMDEGLRDWTTTQHPTPVRPGAQIKYSVQLRALAMHCLAYLPHKRPTFDDIKQCIHMQTSGAGKQEADRLRAAPANDPGFQLFLQEERYPLRSMLYDEARKDPNFFNSVIPPPSPPVPSPSAAGRHDSLGGVEGSKMDFPPDTTPTAQDEALRQQKVKDAWRDADAKKEKARAESHARELMAKLKMEASSQTAQRLKAPSPVAPSWSPLTVKPVSGRGRAAGKRKAKDGGGDVEGGAMEGVEMGEGGGQARTKSKKPTGKRSKVSGPLISF